MMSNILTPFEIQPGLQVRHTKTGGRYRVEMIANLEATGERCVVYRSLETNDAWIRTASNFCSLNEDGQPRFVRDDPPIW